MLTRREVLQNGAALAAGTVTLGAAAAPSRKIRGFLVDARSSDALAIADLMAARDVPVSECRGDLTGIYHEWLAQPAKQDGVLAGVMGVEPLFYIEQLAWTQRIVFLGRHPIAGAHTVGGPQVMIDTFRGSERFTGWRRALARTLRSTPARASSLRPLNAVRDAAISGDTALFSWVLAHT